MKYAFLKGNVVMKVLDVDWLDIELRAIRCEDVDVHAEDTYQDGTFYRNGEPLQTSEQSVQAALQDAKAELEAVYDVVQSLPDEVAIVAPTLFKEWTQDVVYAEGDRVRYDDKLYRCIQNHNAQSDWTPTAAPSLWVAILPGQGGTEIGEWVQPDATNAYKTGDKVTYNGKTYESLIDNNVWSPAAYPGGWKEV